MNDMNIYRATLLNPRSRARLNLSWIMLLAAALIMVDELTSAAIVPVIVAIPVWSYVAGNAIQCARSGYGETAVNWLIALFATLNLVAAILGLA